MSYIVPKEIPNRCGRCPCFHAEHPMYCQAVKADKNKRIYAPYGEGRPDWCPLIEVPPHGRLIDADELVRIWRGAKIYGDIEPIVNARPTRKERIMDEINFTEGFKETLMEILAYCSRNSVTAVTLELGDIEMDIEFRAVAERGELEELNSDYINEHFGDLQDTAYKRGVNDGSIDVKERVDCAYQRGLDDAWEAAKKIALMDTETSENVTGYFGLFRIMENLTPMQAIEKLKAYEEQKADDEIKVGDEVKWNSDLIVVTRLYEAGGFDWCGGISKDGSVFQVLAENVRKTGRHFDIDKILEAMKE